MDSRKRAAKAVLRLFRRGDAGQALIETALTVPLLVLLLVGAVELAQVAYAAIEVSNAAKAAASYGAQDTTTAADATGMATVAANDAYNLQGLITNVAVTGICSDGTACSGSGNTCVNTDCSTSHIETIITVDTQAGITPVFQLPGISNAFTLRGHAVQKCLHCY